MKTVICLMGPTAVGKSDVALQIASQIPSEIISVDSAMVYRGMDIGTAKPTPAEQALVKHHLIDINDPTNPYSAAKFVQDAGQAINSIFQQNKYPLLVGGTMLYFKALQQGLSFLPSADHAIRLKLSEEALEIGWAAMHDRLQSIDPQLAKKISANDPQRIQRALEVYEITKQAPSALFEKDKTDRSSFHFINIAIVPENRILLHEKIATRFTKMLELGLLSEVEALFTRGDLHTDLPAIRSVGYRQAWSYLAGEINFETMVERSIIATRQLAKRQFTWLRQWPELHTFTNTDKNLIEKILKLCKILF